jgi:hypothetical protein
VTENKRKYLEDRPWRFSVAPMMDGIDEEKIRNAYQWLAWGSIRRVVPKVVLGFLLKLVVDLSIELMVVD